MSRKTDALGKLERIARLKSDLEMRRFSAFRAHLIAARERVTRIEGELEAIYRSDSPFSVNEARLTNAIACEKSQALLTAEADLQQLLPGFDAARQRAMREFGRAEVLKNLHASSAEGDQADRIRKLTNDIG